MEEATAPREIDMALVETDMAQVEVATALEVSSPKT
jgi:hypothetical protein